MSNPIKYSTGTDSLALKKGNFYIGTGDLGKGPTSTTGYYNGITPPSGGYTIYLNKETGGPSIYTASNDAQLISLTNSIAGQSYTTVNECLVYFVGQTDKLCVNRDYEGVVTNGLVFGIDAGFTPSYPKNGTTWYDIKNTSNGSFINGTSYNSNSGGMIVFDGTDDYINFGNASSLQITGESATMEVFFKTPLYTNQSNKHFPCLFSKRTHWLGESVAYNFFINNEASQGGFGQISCGFSTVNGYGGVVSNSAVTTNTWIHAACVYNGTDVRLYVNTVLQNSISSATGNIRNINSPLYLGVANANGGLNIGSYRYQGDIPIIRLYNRPLTATEILQNYNAQKGRFGL
jgi:hypothetical protein